MLRIKFVKIKYFYLFQTIVVVIMVNQLMVNQNSRTYFSSGDIDQRELKTKSEKVKPLPMCPEKSLLLLGQLFIHRRIEDQGMIRGHSNNT